MENESASETSPLLGRDSHAPSGAPTAEEHLSWYQLRRPWHIGLVVVLSATIWAISEGTAKASLIFDEFFVDLDFLLLNDVLHYVGRLLVAVPFGILADRARKPVYVLASAGQVLSLAWTLIVALLQLALPRELKLLGAVGQLVGGGMLLISVTHVTILADVLPPEQRLLGFLLLDLVQEISLQFSFILAASLQTVSSLMPLVLSLILALVGACLIVFLPETAQGPKPAQTEQAEADWWSRSKVCLHLRFRELGPALAVAKSSSLLWMMLALTTFTLASLGYWLMAFAYLWSRDGYHYAPELSLASVITRCVTLGVLLPALAVMLVHPNGHARFTGYQRDLVLARVSAVLAIAGVFTFVPATACAFVGTIAVGLSTGFHALGRSLISYLAPANGYATIYTLVLALSTLVSAAFSPFFYQGHLNQSSWAVFYIEVVIVVLLYLVVSVALSQLKVRSTGPGNLEEPGPAGVHGDEGSVLVNDEHPV